LHRPINTHNVLLVTKASGQLGIFPEIAALAKYLGDYNGGIQPQNHQFHHIPIFADFSHNSNDLLFAILQALNYFSGRKALP